MGGIYGHVVAREEEARADEACANADIMPAKFQPPAAIETNPVEIVINVELPGDITGVYHAAAADMLHNQQQNANIPQAAVAIQDSKDGGDDNGVRGKDTESDAADPYDSESDSDYDPNEDPSDEEARFNNQPSTMLHWAHLKIREAGDHETKQDNQKTLHNSGVSPIHQNRYSPSAMAKSSWYTNG